jgi:hypothetical protein
MANILLVSKKSVAKELGTITTPFTRGEARCFRHGYLFVGPHVLGRWMDGIAGKKL